MRALLLSTLVLTGCATVPVEPQIVLPPEPPAWSAANKRDCQGGCAYVRPEGPSNEEIDALLAKVNATDVGSESEALDALLFHNAELARRLATFPAPALRPEWDAYLRSELEHDVALFSLRVIDEHGVVRSELQPTPMKLGSKLHMAMHGDRLPEFNANGTIVRVGRDHVWIRM